MAKTKVSIEAARKVAHANSIIEELLVDLYGTTLPEEGEGRRRSFFFRHALAEDLVGVTEKLDGIQLMLESGIGYRGIPRKMKAKAARAGR